MDIFLNNISGQIFIWSVKNKNLIITAFIITHLLQLGNIVLASILVAQISSGNELGILYYDLGGKFGSLAALSFLVTITPGIAKRFGIHHKIFNIIQTFRRHIGIMTFLLVLTHYAILRLIPLMTWQSFVIPPIRETLGFVAFVMMFLMFLTSNDFSTRRFGSWWGRIHKLAYVIVWLVFVHVAFAEIGPISLLLGIFALAEWASLIYFWTKKKPFIPTNSGSTQIPPDSSSTPNTTPITPTPNQV